MYFYLIFELLENVNNDLQDVAGQYACLNVVVVTESRQQMIRGYIQLRRSGRSGRGNITGPRADVSFVNRIFLCWRKLASWLTIPDCGEN